MNNKPLFYFLLFVCSISGSCNKCVQEQVAALRFSPEELSINPYNGIEEFAFKNLNGDSVQLFGGMRIGKNIRVDQWSPNAAKEDHNGCSGNYYDEDFNSYEIRSGAATTTYFSIKLRFLYDFGAPMAMKEFELEFFSQVNSQPGGDGFDGHYLFRADTLMKIIHSRDSILSYHPMLSLGPRSFQKVYELSCGNPDGSNPEWFSMAYYSIKQGLVGFKTNTGTLWFLDKLPK